jgi:hypothetical protein
MAPLRGRASAGTRWSMDPWHWQWQSLRTAHTQASIISELRYIPIDVIMYNIIDMEEENILEKIVFGTVDIDTTAIIAIQSFS